jgi:phage I-like protein
MFETLTLVAIIYLFLNRRKRSDKKKDRKLRGLDAEFREMIESTYYSEAMAAQIKGYLLSVVADDRDGSAKFSDARVAQAQGILDQAGPAAFYWMTEIATQLAVLSAAQINGVGTNVDAELGGGAVTPEAIVKIVVQG